MVDDERVELRWPGKYIDGRRAPLLDRGATLRERERFGPDDCSNRLNNRLICGDNLLVLEALVRDAPGSVDLVYIDPPFATGNRFALARRLGDKRAGTDAELRLPAFDDAWDGGLAGFLRMLDPRIRLIHQLLAPTGSLYVHVDPTVGHAVKLLLDEVFGPACFQREIVWRIGWVSGFKSRARNWIRNHDLIFFYTKDPQAFTFNKMWVPHPEGYVRREGAAAKAPGVAIDDVWNAGTSELQLQGRESLDSIQIKSFSREKTGWATQKNESLLRRIIAASSNPGDRVADLFAGSGTTAAVAAELGRSFVAVDHADAAVQIARNRLLAADVPFVLCELDEVEIEQRLASVDAAELRAWMLAQLGAAPLEPGEDTLHGRRGDVGVAVFGPHEVIDDSRLRAIEQAARTHGFAQIEVLGFVWQAREEVVHQREADGAPLLVPLQAGRGLFEPSVRASAWIDGGVAVWERPRICVGVEQAAAPESVRISLLGLHLHRREQLPEVLREREWSELLVGWTLADADAPHMPLFTAIRDRSELPLQAELPRRGAWVLACEDVLGHRHVRRVMLGDT